MKMNSKKLVIFLAMMVFCSVTVFAATVKIRINGQEVKSTVAPVEINGTTLVPIRVISENMGAEVEYYKDTQEVLIMKGNLSVDLKLNNKVMIKYNNITEEKESIILNVAPRQINGVTMVPIRAVSDGLECELTFKDGIIDIKASVIETYSTTENEKYIEDELNSKYSVCSTAVGDIKLHYWVYEKQDNTEGWDYSLSTLFVNDDEDFAKLYSGTEATDEQLKARQQLKEYMQGVAEYLMTQHPSTKFNGCYDLSYYEDETDKDSYIPLFFCNWKNYTGDWDAPYASTQVGRFEWVTEYDADLW